MSRTLGSLLAGMVRRKLVADASHPQLHLVLPHVAQQMAHSRQLTPSFYAGFDPTGPSLHLGHLAVIVAMARLQQAGLRPIALVGGATALIGDPTGRVADRPLLSEEQVASNSAGIRRSLEAVLHFESQASSSTSATTSTSAIMVNNADFYRQMNVIHFMRDVGKHFRLGYMLGKESVKTRLQDGGSEGGMSFTEFTYQLFQAHDFLHLHKQQGAVLQIGGSDQWGNITSGTELIRRVLAAEGAGAAGAKQPLHLQLQQQQQQGGSDESVSEEAAMLQAAGPAQAFTVPLILSSTGRKFGKSETGGKTIWINSDLTSHHALYQYLLNTGDAEAPRMLGLLTLLEEEHVAHVTEEQAKQPESRVAQKALAREVTRMLRGEQGLAAAERCASILFGGGASSTAAAAAAGSNSGAAVAAEDLLALADAGDIPTCSLPLLSEWEGKPLVDAMVLAGAAASKAEARRSIAGGAVVLNKTKKVPAGEQGSSYKLSSENFLGGKVALLSVGKKKMWALKAGE